VEKGGQTTVAKEFAIYFKIKVSKSMTNSVRYVFAHCSRPIPFAHPPTPIPKREWGGFRGVFEGVPGGSWSHGVKPSMDVLLCVILV